MKRRSGFQAGKSECVDDDDDGKEYERGEREQENVWHGALLKIRLSLGHEAVMGEICLIIISGENDYCGTSPSSMGRNSPLYDGSRSGAETTIARMSVRYRPTSARARKTGSPLNFEL